MAEAGATAVGAAMILMPLRYEFEADFVVSDEQRYRMGVRLHSSASNECSLVGAIANPIETHLFGRLEGKFEGDSIRAETAFVNCIQRQPGGSLQEVDFQLDDLTIQMGAMWKMAEAGLVMSPTSELTTTWVLSGSRFIAELLKEGPMTFAIDGAQVEFSLEPDEHVDVVERSGHAVREATLLPVLRYRKAAGQTLLSDALAQMQPWQDSVDYLSTWLAFHSKATVAWLERSHGFKHGAGAEPLLWSREFRFRRVSIGPPNLLVQGTADVRQNLAAMASMAAKWGAHIRSAVDFYVSSFVLGDESRFIALSTALETLKEAYQQATGETEFLPETKFKKIREVVRLAISEKLKELGAEGAEALKSEDL